jgi:hypothetical protein
MNSYFLALRNRRNNIFKMIFLLNVDGSQKIFIIKFEFLKIGILLLTLLFSLLIGGLSKGKIS